MLNKFKEFPDTEQPPKPVTEIMLGWADAAAAYKRDRRVITDTLGRVSYEGFLKKRKSDAVESEAALNEVCPDLIRALALLRHGFDGVTGWGIEWRNYVRGDVIAVEADSESIPDATVMKSVRAPAEYELCTGWVAGSQVGVGGVLGGVDIWVQIADEQSWLPNGIFTPFGEMFEIEFIPVLGPEPEPLPHNT